MNSKNKENGCSVNCGIKCDVVSCVHHTSENCCTKDKVKIGNSGALCEEETVCSSFEKCR